MKKKLFYGIWAVLILGMIMGTLFDLDISQALFNQTDPIAVFMNVMAMVPSCAILVVCCCIINYYLRNTKLYYPSFVLPIMAGVVSFKEIGKWAEMSKTMWISFGVLSGIVGIVLFLLLKPRISRKQFIIALVFAFTATFTFGTVEVLKYAWGRRRFYSMDDPASQFMVWYIPHPIAHGDYYKSFPSGHTSFSVLLLFLAFVPEMFNKKINKNILITIALIWIISVIYGRITYGAHFLTDTCIGALNGSFWVYLGNKELEKRL